MADKTSDMDWKVVTAASLPDCADPAAGTIDLWRLDLSARKHAVSAFRKSLDSGEKARAKAYRFRKDGDRFVLRRALTRQVLAAYLGIAPADIMYSQDHPEKPAVDGAPFSFSVAFAGDTGLLAVNHDGEVGVDLEALVDQPALNLVAKDNFTKNERAGLKELQSRTWLEAFLRLWTRKEAVLKLLGTGLSMSPLEIEIAGGHVPDEVLVSWTDEARGQETWTVRHLQLAPETLGAVAVGGNLPQLRFFLLQ